MGYYLAANRQMIAVDIAFEDYKLMNDKRQRLSLSLSPTHGSTQP
jgi:hypothetical protein